MPMLDRQSRLIQIFEDTERFYTEEPLLSAALGKSIAETKLYEEDDYPEIQQTGDKNCMVRVSSKRSFEAAVDQRKKYPDAKIAVLNFASSTNPGGGVLSGSSAQEESLCRCSTLYPTLDQSWLWDRYYQKNRDQYSYLNTDVCIYSPDIIICKSDDDYLTRLDPKDFVTVDVITCAAPNLRHGEEIDDIDLLGLHIQRAKHILHIAAANGAEIVILGAFGCGAFRNDPRIVAKAYSTALKEYAKYFKEIEFAIYHRPYEAENYDAFKDVFKG